MMIFLNYYETYFHCVNYNTGERYYEIYYLMFFYHLYRKIRIEKDTNIYNKELFLHFIKEMKQNEKNDNEEMNFFINEYDTYLIREKERIEEENKEETKQRREIERLEA